MRQLVWKQGNHAIPPGSPGFYPRHCKLSGVCCEGGCARPCPGWRFTRLSPIIQHPAGLRRCPEAWPASRSQIVAASVERSDTMCTDTQSRVLLPSEKKKKKNVEKCRETSRKQLNFGVTFLWQNVCNLFYGYEIKRRTPRAESNYPWFTSNCKLVEVI